MTLTGAVSGRSVADWSVTVRLAVLLRGRLTDCSQSQVSSLARSDLRACGWERQARRGRRGSHQTVTRCRLVVRLSHLVDSTTQSVDSLDRHAHPNRRPVSAKARRRVGPGGTSPVCRRPSLWRDGVVVAWRTFFGLVLRIEG